MALISANATKAHYKHQITNILNRISKSKMKITGDTYPMAYGGLTVYILWTNKNGVCQHFLKFVYWVTTF